MRSLWLTLAALCSLASAQAATLYWAGAAMGAPNGGAGAWLGANLWSTDLAGTTHQTWADGSDANFQGTGGLVTVGGAVSAKTITFGANGYSLSGASTITLAGGSSGFVNTNSFNATIAAPLGGTVGLTKQGTGALVLSGTNSYTGSTVIFAGTLRVNGTHAPTSGIVMASGTVLAGEASYGVPVTADIDAHIDRVGGLISTMGITGGFTWNGSDDSSATIRMELDSGGIGDRITVSGGNLVKGTGTTYKFDFASTGATGTYTLINVTGGTHNFVDADLSYVNLPSGLSGTFNTSDPSRIQFTVVSDTAPAITISAPSANGTATGPITYTVTYTDGNFSSSSLAASDITLNATGNATGTVSVDSDTGATRTVTISNISGQGSLGISIAAGTGVDASGNHAAAAGPSATFFVDSTIPVITSAATASGTYLQTFSYTITASKTVTFSTSTLPVGLTLDATSGEITGTLTSAGTFPITLTATDQANNQATLALLLTVFKKSVTVSGLTVLNKTYDGSVNATLNTSGVVLAGVYASDTNNVTLNISGATATFADSNVGSSKPVTVTGLTLSGSAAANYTLTQPTVTGNIVGQPATVTLSNLNFTYDGQPHAATVTTIPGGLSVSIFYNGSTTVPVDAGIYNVTAQASGGGFGGTATGTLVIAQLSQTITFAALPDRLVSDGPVTLSATASSGLPVSFAVTGPVTQSGNVLTSTGAEGTVTITASQSGSTNYAAAPNVVRTYAITNRPAPGLYFGTFAGDRSDAAFGFLLRPDYSGVFAGFLPTLGIGLTRNVQVDQNGSFSASFVPLGSNLTVTLRGRITGGTISGNLDPFAVTFSGNSAGPVSSVSSDTATPPVAAAARENAVAGESTLAAGAPVSGLYQVVAVGTTGTTTVTVFAGADGRAYVFTSDGTRASGAATTITNAGALAVTMPDQTKIALSFGANGTASGTLTPTSGVATTITGGAEAVASTVRMLNMSARGRTGPDSATLIAGFVINGASQKRVLVRVAGPVLTNFGVNNVLANPTLTIINNAGGAVMGSNDDWGVQSPANPDIAVQMASIGAFNFAANSKDSAIVLRLPPGAYTALAGGGAGTVLTEVYELLDAGEVPAAKKIINFSARGQVGVLNEPLTAGFVIGGNVPKRVLIRGIGPSIASALPGAIANPRVRVFDVNGTRLAENDDWFRDANASQIAAAAASVGAFALGAQNLDASLLIVLQPGAYTAIVDDAGGATGLGLVEVYEVP